ncbi:MAG: glycoside-pentoside-hexuronide (GPH):cation symporter, partial [Cetobacterium sp.]
SLSTDKKEREEIAVVPRIFASLAWLSLGSFGLPLIAFLGKGNEAKGFSLLSLGIAAVFILTTIVTVVNVKEQVTTKKAAEKINLKHAFKLILKNDQLVALIGTILMFNLMAQISGGVAIYYFKYVVGMEKLFSVFTGFSGIAEISSLMMFPLLSRKIGRKNVFFLGCGLPVIGFLMLFISGIVAPANLILVAASGIVAKLGSGLTLGISTVMLADVVDYGEFKFGSRNESVIFSVQTLLVKSASAISGWLIGMGLSLVGYVPNVVQNSSSILGIKYLMIVFPILLSIFGYVIYKKYYKLNGDYYDEVMDAVNNKREVEA